MSFFWLVLCYVVWRQATTMKKRLNFDGLSRQQPIARYFSWIVPTLVTHMKHIHACLVKISSFIFSRQTKNSPVYLLKLAIIRNFGLIRDFTAKFLKSFGKNLWFLLAQINEISFFPKRSKNLLVKVLD